MPAEIATASVHVRDSYIPLMRCRADPSRNPMASAAHHGREIQKEAGMAAIPSSAPFQPLDPGIVSEAIPAFFIGRNKEGFWVARDATGNIGGIFLLENSALSFAKQNSRPAGCATIFPSERFELDLENRGNRLAAHLGPLVHLAMRHRQ